MKAKHICVIVAGSAMMAACTSELDVQVPNGENVVMLTAQLPGNLSRTFGDGTTAKNLQCAVYEHGVTNPTPLPVFGTTETVGTATFNNLSTTVKLYLAQGKTYDIVFWASASDSPYTFDATKQTVTADYSATVCNNENLDAFYSVTKLEVSPTTTSANVELKRPFAQLNIGTSDYDAAVSAGYTVTQAAVTVTDVNTTFNLLTETVTGDATNVTFALGDIPSATAESFPVTGYRYLAMNYVLVGSDNATTSVTIKLADANSKTIESTYTGVPIKANYRTNIYGSLITNPVDHTVTINPQFNPTDNSYEVWDGTSMSAPSLNEAGDAYEITKPSELAYLLNASGVIANSSEASAKRNSRATAVTVFNLRSNMDMGGKTIPVPAANDYGVFQFHNLTFNGNGYTISNFKTDNYGDCVGLFPLAVDITVKDLKVENATVGVSTPNGDAYAGVICGNAFGSNFENITVSDCTVNGVNKVGGILGFANEDCATITNCKVVNTTLNGIGTDAGCVGGILGYVGAFKQDDGAVLENCSVEGITINVPDGEAKASRGNSYFIGTVGTTSTVSLTECLAGDGNTIVSNYTDNTYVGADRNGNANIVINNHGMSMEDITKYPDLYYDDNKDFHIYNAEGFASLNKYYKDNWCGWRPFTSKIYIENDIDMTGYTWTSLWLGNPSNTAGACPGVRLYGQNHIISNITISGSGMFGGGMTSAGDNDYCEFKDITFSNATVSGGFHVGVLIGQSANDVVFDNVNVIDSDITGTCNVGGIAGSTGEFGTAPTLTFKNCSVSNTKITALGGTGVDPTGASGFVGRLLLPSKIVFEGTNAVSNNTITNPAECVGGSVYGFTQYSNGWTNTGVSDTFTNN